MANAPSAVNKLFDTPGASPHSRDAMKLSRTQKAKLMEWVYGTPSGLQTNHAINADHGLYKRGFLKVTYIENRVIREVSEAGREAAKALLG